MQLSAILEKRAQAEVTSQACTQAREQALQAAQQAESALQASEVSWKERHSSLQV